MDNDDLMTHAVEKLRATQTTPSRPCKICRAESIPYDVVDFNKSCASPDYPPAMSMIPVIYRKCQECGFIYTDFFDDFSADQWTRYVYNEDYIKVDPEYASIRPRQNASSLACFLTRPKESVIGLDYGGGNGLTAALLRRQGWIYDSFDPFGYTDILPERIGRYNFCTAIEVFEHSTDPVGLLQGLLEKASPDRLIVVITTATTDGSLSNHTRLAWWYAAPRNGHVSLYSLNSLDVLAKRFGLMCTYIRSPPYLLTRGFGAREARKVIIDGKLRRIRQKLRQRLGLRNAVNIATEVS